MQMQAWARLGHKISGRNGKYQSRVISNQIGRLQRNIGNWDRDGLAFVGVAAQAGKIGGCTHTRVTGPGRAAGSPRPLISF